MSVVTIAPAALGSSATYLAGIGDSLTMVYTTAAAPTIGLLSAAKDEVSTAIAALFSDYGQQYQALSAEAASFHQRFVQLLNGSGSQYASAEVTNATSLHTSEKDLINVINAPAMALTGHPLIGNGTSGTAGGHLIPTRADATQPGDPGGQPGQPGQGGSGGPGGNANGGGGTTTTNGGGGTTTTNGGGGTTSTKGGGGPFSQLPLGLSSLTNWLNQFENLANAYTPAPVLHFVTNTGQAVLNIGLNPQLLGYSAQIEAVGSLMDNLVGGELGHLDPLTNAVFFTVDVTNTLNDFQSGNLASGVLDLIGDGGDVTAFVPGLDILGSSISVAATGAHDLVQSSGTESSIDHTITTVTNTVSHAVQDTAKTVANAAVDTAKNVGKGAGDAWNGLLSLVGAKHN